MDIWDMKLKKMSEDGHKSLEDDLKSCLMSVVKKENNPFPQAWVTCQFNADEDGIYVEVCPSTKQEVNKLDPVI